MPRTRRPTGSIGPLRTVTAKPQPSLAQTPGFCTHGYQWTFVCPCSWACSAAQHTFTSSAQMQWAQHRSRPRLPGRTASSGQPTRMRACGRASWVQQSRRKSRHGPSKPAMRLRTISGRTWRICKQVRTLNTQVVCPQLCVRPVMEQMPVAGAFATRTCVSCLRVLRNCGARMTASQPQSHALQLLVPQPGSGFCNDAPITPYDGVANLLQAS